MAGMDVDAACTEVLGKLGLDDDCLQYIAQGIMGEACALLSRDDLVEFAAPLLEDHCAGDEARAASIAGSLHDRLMQGVKEEDRPICQDPEKVVKPQAVMLGSLFSAKEGLPPKELQSLFPELLGSYASEEPAPITATGQRQRVAKAKSVANEEKDLKRKAQKTARFAAEVEADVRAACDKAAMLRASQGVNFNAALKLGPFDLPHPQGGRHLLENAILSLTPGRRYALVGRNGKGKSTLLRHLAARRIDGLPQSATLHYVSQEVSFSAMAMEQTAVEAVLAADVERRLLLEEVEALEGKATPQENERFKACLSRLEAIGAESAEHRAVQLLSNLGFSDELRARRLQALSGGWRVRVALAAALFAKPDILLLDEPTNHLSMQAVLWLSHELSHSQVWQPRTMVVVSHDRFFIDRTCTDVLHISGVARRLTHSRCDYSTWARVRCEQQRARERQSKVRADEREKLLEYIRSGQAAAGNTSNFSRKQRLKKLDEEAAADAEELAALEEDADLPLVLHAGGSIGGVIVQPQNVTFSYPASAKPLFRGVGVDPHSFTVTCTSRIVLVGENGNGKTTLLKLLLGELEPTDGEMVRNRGARFALVNQHHADQIDLAMSPMQFMRRKFPGDSSDAWLRTLRSHLEQCGLAAELLNVASSALSGGQRSRLAMAAVSFEKPHVLFMDEPTNNLDLSSAEALADAVDRFEGGVVLVSHDKHFVSRVAREVWVVGDDAVRRAESFERYQLQMLYAVVPQSDLARKAWDAYKAKKLAQSAGRVSRVDLDREYKSLFG
mmetsp:Transcript_10056/g.28375  ORF Transcript_10056/g.28375 Transcript_10056/m.28375 type:complete len:785 (-) Transcript_10056:95-2449(-)